PPSPWCTATWHERPRAGRPSPASTPAGDPHRHTTGTQPASWGPCLRPPRPPWSPSLEVRKLEMEEIITHISAQNSQFRPRAPARTAAAVMRPPLTTVGQHAHLAAAAYLMKHAGTTALIVTDTQTGQPAGIITEADITHAIAHGTNINDVR